MRGATVHTQCAEMQKGCQNKNCIFRAMLNDMKWQSMSYIVEFIPEMSTILEFVKMGRELTVIYTCIQDRVSFSI